MINYPISQLCRAGLALILAKTGNFWRIFFWPLWATVDQIDASHYVLRRSEKHKKLKMILPIVRKVVYIYTKQGSGLKKSNLGHFPMRKWPTKWLLCLYKWKKNCSDYGVHGIQIERLGLTVPTQKSVLKNMHRVPRYRPKCVKFCWFGLEGRFWTLFW